MIRSDLIVIVIIALLIRSSSAQYPRIPCPDIFKYENVDGTNTGKIDLDMNYGVTVLEVVLSQPALSNPDNAGKVDLAININDIYSYIEERRPVPFRVFFQYQSIIPQVTAIRVNGATICSGPRVSSTPSSSTYFKRTLTVPDPSSGKYKTQSPPRNSNAYDAGYATTTSTTVATTSPSTTTTSAPLPSFIKKLRPPTLEQISRVCGKENTNTETRKLAVNGEDIPKSRFPWIVALYKKQLGQLNFICGASLISQSTVISAAHCFYESFYLIRHDDILVSLGRHNLTSWADPDIVHKEVERIIQHPDYKVELDNADADLALIRLREPVTFSYTVRPICLWDGTFLSLDVQAIVGVPGIVVGWGRDENNRSVTTTPKLVNATVASEFSCLENKSPELGQTFFSLTSNRTLCAGNRDGSGPCTGDSGSGLMIFIRNKWMLRGIVSVALSDPNKGCDLKEYVVYTDIAQFIGWIFANML